MDDLITICIADDPPVKLTASRAILVANSKVFADMLSMPQGASVGASKDTVTVAEKADEIKPFLRLLNIAHEEGDPLEELEPDVWPTMATLGDKYDAPGVTLSALCKYWEYLQSDNAACLASCSRIAVSLGRQDLITPAAFSVLNEDAVTTILTPTEWSSQFANWKRELKLHAFECSIKPPPRIACCYTRPSASSCSDPTSAWQDGTREAMETWSDGHAADPFLDAMRAACCRASRCGIHQEKFMERVEEFEQCFRDTTPSFPL